MSGDIEIVECACGRAVAIKSAGECRTCYNARYHRERVARDLSRPCHDCGLQPAEFASTGLCKRCTTIRRRRSRTTDVSYEGAHQRVAADRGSAHLHRCVACGGQAEEWAYRPGSPRELTGFVVRDGVRKNMLWSGDPADYDPLCRLCHGARDRSDYGKGRRRDPEQRREWARASYHRAMADPAKRSARNERQRAWRADRRGEPP